MSFKPTTVHIKLPRFNVLPQSVPQEVGLGDKANRCRDVKMNGDRGVVDVQEGAKQFVLAGEEPLQDTAFKPDPIRIPSNREIDPMRIVEFRIRASPRI